MKKNTAKRDILVIRCLTKCDLYVVLCTHRHTPRVYGLCHLLHIFLISLKPATSVYTVSCVHVCAHVCKCVQCLYSILHKLLVLITSPFGISSGLLFASSSVALSSNTLKPAAGSSELYKGTESRVVCVAYLYFLEHQ